MDQTQDSSFTLLHEYTQLYGDLPSYVKNASQEETLSPEGLTPTSYADMVGRKFPLHTKAACYISSMYFLENRDSLPIELRAPVANNLSKAAEQHGIVSDITKLVERSEELKKQAAYINPSDCMLPSENRYPMRNPEEVKQAGEYLMKYRAWFPLDTRIDMATRVLKRAEALGVELAPDLNVSLQKRAGWGTYSPDEVCDQIVYRKTLATDPSIKEALTKLASLVEENPQLAIDRAAVRDLAISLDDIDRRLGIKYGNAIKQPEDFLFGGLYETAKSAAQSRFGTATGSIYEKDQLAGIGKDMVTEMFGEKCASDTSNLIGVDIEKLASHISSLNYMDALSFDWQMRSLGKMPVSEMPTAMGISHDQRAKLAQEYESLTSG